MNAEDFKSAGKNNPSQDFTNRLMQEIQREERALESLLRQHGKMETSASFVASLEMQLEGERVKKTYTPLFGFGSWMLVACIAIGLFALPFVLGTSTAPDSGSTVHWQHYGNQMTGFMQNYMSPYLLLPALVLFMFAFFRSPGKVKA